MNLSELREAHSQKVQKADELSAKELDAEGQEEFSATLTEIESIQDQIDNGVKLESYKQWSNESAGRVSTPREPQSEPVHEDLKQYSLLRAIDGQCKDSKFDGLEREVHDELTRKYGSSKNGGFYIPHDLQVQRFDMTTTGSAGVVETVTSGDFIDVLRARMLMNTLGATFLSGMQGDFEIPKKTATSSGTWFDSESGSASESSPTIGQVAFSPTSVGSYIDLTRKFVKQSSRDAEMLARQDLVDTLAHAVDAAALSGAGSGGEPQGVEGDSNITAVALGTDGAAPTWAKLVTQEGNVDNGNALLSGGKFAYVTTPSALSKFKTTEKASGTARYLAEDGEVNGYNVYSTNGLSSDLTKGCGTALSSCIFGNWADLVIASWGPLDIVVDPYTQAPTLRIHAYHDVQIKLRRAESFSRIVDIVTT